MEIWKWILEAKDCQHIVMPTGAKPLYAAAQHDQLVVYAHVNPDRPKVPRTVFVHGTGHTTRFSDEAQSLGVVSLHGGDLMFHVFIEKEGT